MRDLVQSLQQLGYLPSATQQIRGELTHKVVQVPPLEDLEADLDRMVNIVQRNASAGEVRQIEKVKAQFARLALADGIDRIQQTTLPAQQDEVE